MEYNDFIIDLQTKDEIIEIIHAGDSHIPSLNFAKKEFEEFCGYANENKRSFICFMGDIFDSITPTDKRQYIHNIDPKMKTISEAQAYFEMRVKPFKNRIFGFHQGNHERKLEMRTTICPMRQSAYNLYGTHEDDIKINKNIRYLYVIAMTTIKLRWSGRIIKTYDLFSTHGSGGGRKLGSKVNKLMDYASYFHADAYFSGHVHESFSGVKPVIKKVGRRGVAIPKTFAFTLSFLKSYVDGISGYEETKNYDPLSIGYLKTKCDRKRLYKPEEVIL